MGIDSVATHYNTTILNYELERLDVHSPVEKAMMLLLLEKVHFQGCHVLDVGVGNGNYAQCLAENGCYLHLVDISQALLDATVKKLEKHGLTKQIASCSVASALNIEAIGDNKMDLLLLLGPLYHLCLVEDRIAALREAKRVLKPGGKIFASGINRLAYFRDLYRSPEFLGNSENNLLRMKDSFKKLINDGILNSTLSPPLGRAYLSCPTEFRTMLKQFFNENDFLGLESFTAHLQSKIKEESSEMQQFWINLVEETCRTEEGICCSEHILFVGEKSSYL